MSKLQVSNATKTFCIDLDNINELGGGNYNTHGINVCGVKVPLSIVSAESASTDCDSTLRYSICSGNATCCKTLFLDTAKPTLATQICNTTYYAAKCVKYKVKYTYKVTFNTNSATSSTYPACKCINTAYDSTSISFCIKSIANCSISRTGYCFNGWLNSADNKVYNTITLISVSQPITLTAQWLLPADIPAGTYYPNCFASLISNYISPNSCRYISQATSVTVNGTSVNLSAGDVICLNYPYSGSSFVFQTVSFGQSASKTSGFVDYAIKSFDTNQVYVICVAGTSQNCWSKYFNCYTCFPITVNCGIYFC